MLFLGTAVNAATVAAGGILGCLAGSRLPARLSPAAFRAIGLFTLVMGVSMALETGSFLILAISCIAGASRRHTGMTCGQRLQNLQPGSTELGPGISPRRVACSRLRIRGSGCGTEANKARV